MNGIMPGPLFLAIASAAKNDSLENGTLIHRSGNATFTDNMSDIQRQVSILEAKGRKGEEGESSSTTRNLKQEGG